MKKLILANWKAHPETLAQARELMVRLEEDMRGLAPADQIDVVVCPPPDFRAEVADMLKEGVLVQTAQLGAQDIELAGGGEVLAALGVRYVIVGHSDRRWKAEESDDMVNAKLKAVLAAGMTPIVCLGERTRVGPWQGELATQTAATFQGLTPGQALQCLIAYEPVWAISTNPDATPDTPANAVQAMGVIRDTLVDRFDVAHHTFLYGGSVNPDNAVDFLSRPEIAGVLVGKASLNPDEFAQILRVAMELR